MAIKQNSSRLTETSFSNTNLRSSLISDQAEYIAALRDEAMFSNWGLQVLVKVPVDEFGELNENNVDEYSNFVDTFWASTTETVVPKFKEYRQNVSEDGMSADGTDAIYPLEVLIPTRLHLPRNSRIVFTEYNSKEEKIAREWVVLGTIMKQLSNSKTYSRIANCVPAREETHLTTDIYNGDLYFNTVIKPITAKESFDKWAWGDFFVTCTVNMEGISKVVRLDAIQEIPENSLYPNIQEEIEIVEEVIEETILAVDENASEIIRKTITPYRLVACFSAKPLAISVLH